MADSSGPGPDRDSDILQDELKADKPEDTFRVLWGEALRKFQQSTDVESKRWESMIRRMSSCTSVEDVSSVLDETIRKLEHSRGGNARWTKLVDTYLKPIIQVLLVFSDTIAEAAAFFPAVPGGKSIFVAFAVLLEATNGVEERRTALIALLEELHFFHASLLIRLSSPVTLGRSSKIVAIAIMACVLDILLIATKLFSPSAWRIRRALFRQAITKDTSIQSAINRLRTLTNMETRAIAAETQVLTVETQAVVRRIHVAIEDMGNRMVSEFKVMMQELKVMSASERQRCTKVDTAKLLDVLDRVRLADIDCQHSNGCLEGTRVGILDDLVTWARDAHSPRIFWLNGMAGTGKSAIARSFARKLRSEGLLGGSFFCYRMVAEQSNAKRILPTLAASLALRDSHCTAALLAELDDDPPVREWALKVQLKRLLCKPFAGIEHDDESLPIMVIDALDECSDDNVIRDLLTELLDCVGSLPVKFFLTSRPEPHIREHLEHIHLGLGQSMRLHDIEHAIVGKDISRFLTHSLHNVRKDLRQSLPNWPAQADIDALARLSGKLFIYAFTAVLYIQKNPVDRLARLTGTVVTAGHAMTRPLDDIYNLVLSDAMTDEYENDEIDLTCRMISIVVSLRQPLTVVALANLLDVPAYRVRASLDRLYAVIYVPLKDDEGFLSTFHASFEDFLSTAERAPEYMKPYMQNSQSYLADACLNRMQSKDLCFNMSCARTSYLSNKMQKLARIPDDLVYVSLHWAYHVATKLSDNYDHMLLHKLKDTFLGPKFLFWLEALGLIGRAREASESLRLLREALSKYKAFELIDFMRDATGFVERFHSIAEESTPHIYLSGLVFCHQFRVLRRYCLPTFPDLAELALQEPHTDVVWGRLTCATVSHDGKRVAAGFKSGKICLYDINRSPSLSYASEGYANGMITSIKFSPDGINIVYAISDNTICIWNTQTHRGIWCSGHKGSIGAVAFSPDGHTIASGSSDCTVRLWNAKDGSQMGSPLSHRHGVTSMVFSPDGKRLVSSACDSTIYLWRVDTSGFNPLKSLCVKRTAALGGMCPILSVTFSADGQGIVSGAAHDGCMCVRDLKGKLIFQANVFPSKIRRFSASPDGTQAAFVVADGSVYLMDIVTRAASPDYASARRLGSCKADVRSVEFSPDGSKLMTCECNGTVCLWDLDPDLVKPYLLDSASDVSSTSRKNKSTSISPSNASPTLSLPDFWFDDSDGWIKDMSYNPPHLLLWIPHDMRKHDLYFPPFCSIVAPHATLRLELKSLVHGPHWTECYRGKHDDDEGTRESTSMVGVTVR